MIMKRLIFIAAGIFLMVFAGKNAVAQEGVSNDIAESVPAGATIMQIIAIEQVEDMHFGSIVPGTEAGTVLLGTDGTRTETNVTLFTTAPGSNEQAHAASFTVTGEGSYAYTVSLPTSINLSGTGTAMVVDNFTHNATGTLSENLGTQGTETFAVGATLNVNANQATGEYTGTFDVTVTYD
jgi:hypothetical protein